MADPAPPLPSALASVLSTLLPCGFAVGPSRLCEGRLGLWWVGRSLPAGSLLGRVGDTEWASDYHSTGDCEPESGAEQTTSAEVEKVNRTFQNRKHECIYVTWNQRPCWQMEQTKKVSSSSGNKTIYTVTFDITPQVQPKSPPSPPFC